MSNPGEADLTPIEHVSQLAGWFAAGAKPREAWRVGTEHEKFGFRLTDHAPPPYEPGGIRAVLEGLAASFGWAPIADGGNIIGLRRGAASVSLEPGGQFELSGAPLESVIETQAELAGHFAEVRAVAGPLGLGFAPLGFHPLAARAAMPWMPKPRYAIMRAYMPKVGALGLDMMLRTCTVQANLDFGSEADMVEKLRIGLCLQPLATALFANSPFREGRPAGLLSARAHVWTDTDADRTGIPACVFEDGFGFERFAEFVLDVPMYFVVRDGAYVDATGTRFRDFLARGLPGRPDIRATTGDWADHVTTVFTEVRLKRFLEMRGADAGAPDMLAALPAFWVGLLYDDAAQKAALALIRGWQVGAIRSLREAAPREALRAMIAGRTLREVARDALAIARQGLLARGRGEARLLDPLDEIAASGVTRAERALALYAGAWRGETARALDAAMV
jgi:glutamate--cysteine ligase